jgi:two-component system catabolic regulation response regulator CreB/two-component system response regulator ChvI
MKKKKVMIVDDELDLSLLLKTLLEENNFRVDWYTDPVLALNKFKRNFYDLLLLDIKMPKMNGFELYRELKKIEKRVKVCFLTALTELYEYDKFKEEVSPKEDERYFIPKPIENEDLIKRVNSIIDSR